MLVLAQRSAALRGAILLLASLGGACLCLIADAALPPLPLPAIFTVCLLVALPLQGWRWNQTKVPLYGWPCWMQLST